MLLAVIPSQSHTVMDNTQQPPQGGVPVAGQPPPPIFIILMFMMMYFYSSPAGTSSPGMASPRQLFNAKLARDTQALDVLNQTRWGDFAPSQVGEDKVLGADARYLNITGFRQEDGYSWGRLGKVKERFGILQREVGIRFGKEGLLEEGEDWAVYENVTGVVRGPWVRSRGAGFDNQGEGSWNLNISAIAPDTDWAWQEWNRNITGRDGKAMIRIEDFNGPRGQAERREGKVVVPGAPREVAATLTVQDESSTGDGWDMRLHGIQWPHTGSLVLTTTSNKFAGIYGLPHLAFNKDEFNDTQRMLNKTLGDIIRRKQNSVWIDMRDPWSDDSNMPVPHCEYIVYVQIHPIKKDQLGINDKLNSKSDKPDLQAVVNDIEQELRFPTGAPYVKAPPLDMSLVIFSPDCDFVLESKGPPSYVAAEGLHLQGYKQEVYVSRVKNWLLVWGAAIFGQVFLLLGQMKDASTPSTVSRISMYTIGTMVAVDFVLFFSCVMVGSSVPSVFPTMMLTGFACSMGVIMGGRFMTDINKVQAPERREREREREREEAQAAQAARAARTPATQPATATPVVPIIAAPEAEGLPLPATATRPTTINDVPIIIPSDQDIDAEIAENIANGAAAVPLPGNTQRPAAPQLTSRQEFAASFGPIIISTMFFFLISVNSMSWPLAARTFYVNTLVTIYLSFWVPQIYRNIMRNCRKALLRKFVVGQSILRAVPIAYFYLKKDNIIFSQTSATSMAILAGWLWLQVWVLFAQEVLGPRFGWPKGWLPEAWDYHPILREDDVEGGEMPIGLVQIPSSPTLERTGTGEESRKKHDNHSRTVDCAICMNALEVRVLPATGADDSSSTGAGGVQGMLARRAYMVTPCRHVFHSVCLEGWMKFRLQCPICREPLPAL